MAAPEPATTHSEMYRHPGHHIRRDGDQSAAAGNAIHKAAQKNQRADHQACFQQFIHVLVSLFRIPGDYTTGSKKKLAISPKYAILLKKV